MPAVRRPLTGEVLEIQGARQHNLRDIDVAIPLGNFVAVTGVSGSGKSTLVRDILLPVLMQRIYTSKTPPGKHRRVVGLELLDKVIDMDQSPIGRTPRSNPATYTGVFDSIRKLFAATNEAKVRGYLPGRFSFNVKGGRCEACAGDGTIKIEMHFLPDVYVPCEVCKGARYNRDTLDIEFKGHNIADVLDMPIAEAVEFFANQPSIARYMHTLMDVGLGYVRLGQPAPTLSGGEAQRVKLATELAKRSTGHTIYLLDEPTTGLHFDDVRRLLTVLSRLVDQGNTVLVIEHNLDVIKTADWIIDLGPEGGSGGGTVVAEGAPEHVATVETSHTGRYLRDALRGSRGRSAAAAHPLRQLVEPRLLVAAEAVHPQLGDLVEDGVELGLIGRRLHRRGRLGERPGRTAAGRARPRTGDDVAAATAGTTLFRRRPLSAVTPSEAADRHRRYPWKVAEQAHRASRDGGDGEGDEQEHDALLVAVAEQLEDLDAEDHCADDPARDPEEEAGEGILGDEEQEDAQLDRADPPLRQVDQGPDDAGDHGRPDRGTPQSGRGRAIAPPRCRSTRTPPA